VWILSSSLGHMMRRLVLFAGAAAGVDAACPAWPKSTFSLVDSDELQGHIGYDRFETPGEALHNRSSGIPVPMTNVSLSLALFGVEVVDTRTQSFVASVGVFQRWNDPRLAFDPSCVRMASDGMVHLAMDPTGVLWTPEWFVDNLAKGRPKSIDKLQTFFFLAPNGDVMLTSREYWVVSCSMSFKKLPYDVQDCPIQIVAVPQFRDRMVITPMGSGFQEARFGLSFGGTLEWRTAVGGVTKKLREFPAGMDGISRSFDMFEFHIKLERSQPPSPCRTRCPGGASRLHAKTSLSPSLPAHHMVQHVMRQTPDDTLTWRPAVHPLLASRRTGRLAIT
jgi:hypothetical protein